MATHSSGLAWRIPWTKEPGGLQSMVSHRVRRDWVTELNIYIYIYRLHGVLAAASSIFWLWHAGSSSLIRNQAQAPWIGSNESGGQVPFLSTFRRVREELVLIIWTYGKLHYLSHLSLSFSFLFGGAGGSFLITNSTSLFSMCLI